MLHLQRRPHPSVQYLRRFLRPTASQKERRVQRSRGHPVSRKLIEVALPLEAISTASRRDKDRKTGSIKNVHKWFAPMPTPAWRALLFAAVVNDPGEGPARDEFLDLVTRLVPEDGTSPS